MSERVVTQIIEEEGTVTVTATDDEGYQYSSIRTIYNGDTATAIEKATQDVLGKK